MMWGEEWGSLWGGPNADDEDVVDVGLARFREQYKDKPRLEAFVRVFLQHVQKIENTMAAVRYLRSLNYANGAQLDVIGAWVDLKRPSTDDEAYRVLMAFKIQVVLPNTATTEGLLAIGYRMNGGSMSGVTMAWFYPAAYCLTVPILNDPLLPYYKQILSTAGPLGVGSCFVFSDSENPFIFDSTVNPIPGAGTFDSAVAALQGAGIWASVL